MMILYEWLSRRGRGVMAEWLATLPVPDQGRIESKLEDLSKAELHNLPGLVFCPVKDYKQKKWKKICKIKVRGENVQYRPLLCKGPMKGEANALTFLVGATEKGWMLIPRKAPRIADDRRRRLIHSQDRRQRYET